MKKTKLLLFAAFSLLMYTSCMEDISDTNDDDNQNLISDYDGNSYKTVVIGNKTWMAENLKTSHYNNGDAIETSDAFPDNSTVKLQYPAGGDEANVAVYGRFYTWAALTDTRGVCPQGWHVPTEDEWIEMETSLGLVYTTPTSGQIGTNEGGKLKEAGTEHWNDPNVGATNESGFTALPAGVRGSNGFSEIGNFASFWTATTEMGDNAWVHEVNKAFEKIYHYGGPKTVAKSCRCVKD